MDHKIVIIDDNFAIRQIVKIFLTLTSKRFTKDISVFSTDNGVEGLGFIYITSPDIIVVDTTLPKYSGREVVDYLVNNPKFQTTKTKVVILQEQNKPHNFPSHFFVINKEGKSAFRQLCEVLLSCLQISPKENRGKLFNRLGSFVFRNANRSDISVKKGRNRFFLVRTPQSIHRFFSEGFSRVFLTLMVLIYGKPKDENITQKDLDKREFRRKYYPTLVVSFVAMAMLGLSVSLFALTQYQLFKSRSEESRALSTLTVNSTLDLEDLNPGDGLCDVTDGDGVCTLRAAIQEANEDSEAVDVSFDIENQVTKVADTDNEQAAGEGTQKRTFYDDVNNLYFAFYLDQGEIKVTTSKDETSWEDQEQELFTDDIDSFSLYYKNISNSPWVFFTYTKDYDTYFQAISYGVVGDLSAISGPHKVFEGSSASDFYTKPVVSVSESNYIWVAARKNLVVDDIPLNSIVIKRSANLATDVMSLDSWEDNIEHEIAGANSGDIALLPQTGSNMVLISGGNSNNVSAWKYDGSEWVVTTGEYDFFDIGQGQTNTGLNGTVNTTLVHENYLYLGGSFTTAHNSSGDLSVNHIARIDISSSGNDFEAIGGGSTKGVDDTVNSLAASGNYLYLGGNFIKAYTSSGDLSVSHIARIDISSIGNDFEGLGNAPWNNQGVGGNVYALTISGNYLYLGGNFTTAFASFGGMTVNRIARIDISSPGNSFEALGNGNISNKGVNSGVYALVTSENYLYLGGQFTKAYTLSGELTVNYVARLDISSSGKSFEALGDGETKGLSNLVLSLAISDNYLYLGGVFTAANTATGPLTVNHVARIDSSSPGSGFETIGNGLPKGVNNTVSTLTIHDDYLYLGGAFTSIPYGSTQKVAGRIARIDISSSGNNYEALGDSTSNKGVDSSVSSFAVYGNYLYLGGSFTTAYTNAGNLETKRVAKIDISSAGNSFEALQDDLAFGVDGAVSDIIVLGDYLYLGGSFTTAYTSSGDLTVNHIARINISTSGSDFEALGAGATKGVNATVLSLAASGDYIYMGGIFYTAYTSSGNIPVNFVTRIDVSSTENDFEALGAGVTKGVNSTVNSLTATDDYLYLGGSFTTAYTSSGDLTVNRIAKINISSPGNDFEAIGNGSTKGVNGSVGPLVVSGDYLYLGGGFTTAYTSSGDLTVNRIAKINILSSGSDFETLGNGTTKGVNGNVIAMTVSGNYLYLGGAFTTAYTSSGELTVNHIAKIDISSSENDFESLGNGSTKGVQASVGSLAISGNYLYLGGSFTAAYASPSNIIVNYITRIDISSPGNSFEALGGGVTKGIGGEVDSFTMSGDHLYLGGSFNSANTSSGETTVNNIASYYGDVALNVGDDSKISATNDSAGNIHLTYTRPDGKIYYKEMNVSSTVWSEEEEIHSDAVDSQSLYYDSVNSKLTVFYTAGGKLYYKQASSPYTNWGAGVLLDSASVSYVSTGQSLTTEYPFLTYIKESQGAYSVNFGLLGSQNVYTIAPTTELPTITNPSVVLDASTQPGASCTTHDLKIALKPGNGLFINGSSAALRFNSNPSSEEFSILRGFYINNFMSSGLHGINISGNTDLRIYCNVIGLDENDDTASNGRGIVVDSASEVRIGGSSIEDRNVISGNSAGIDISTEATFQMSGNFIGTDKTGTLSRSNDIGIKIQSFDADIVIGGTEGLSPSTECAGSCNLISGNGTGISFMNSETSVPVDVEILGNFIGTDVTGNSALPNGTGIAMEMGDPVIGGSSIDHRNVISGNLSHGILMENNYDNDMEVTIQRNYIGTNANGSSLLGNGDNGIYFKTGGRPVTLTGDIIENTISGNGDNGIFADVRIDEEVPDDPVYDGLDLDITGNTINSNANSGIVIAGNYASISSNTLIDNGNAGIEYVHGNNIDILSNNISGDSDYGIILPTWLTVVYTDFGTGANLSENLIDVHPAIRLYMNRNANDLGDEDIGPNNMQNYPVLTSAEVAEVDTSVYGTFNSESNTYYRIETFGYTESTTTEPIAEIYIGSTIIQTDGSGDYDFSTTPLNIVGIPEEYEYLTATATKCNDSTCSDPIETSELSDGVEITYLDPTPTPTHTPEPSDTPEPTPTNAPYPTSTGAAMWHSTLDDDNALENPTIGTGASSHSVTYEPGVIGNAIVVDDSEKGVTVPIIANTDWNPSKGSIEFYYKPAVEENVSPSLVLFSIRNDSNNKIRVVKESSSVAGGLGFQYVHNGTNSTLAVDQSDYASIWNIGEWMHFRVNWDDSQGEEGDMQMFVNGVELPHTRLRGEIDSSNFALPATLYLCNDESGNPDPETGHCQGSLDDFKILGDPVIPEPTDTPVPTNTNTPVPTPTNTVVPSNTPVPVPTSTPVPTNTSVPVVSNTPVTTQGVTQVSSTPTLTITPTEEEELLPTNTETPAETVTPTTEVTVSPTTRTTLQSLRNIVIPTSNYTPPEESVNNLPVVQSAVLTVAQRVEEVRESSPRLGSVLDATIGFSARVKPLSDNMKYLMSLQFIGTQTAIAGVTSINVLALAGSAIAASVAQPRVMYYAIAWFWRRKKSYPWGIISDKMTNSPVAFARVILTQEGKSVESQTTDLQGKYGFAVNKGVYQLQVSHSDYIELVKDIKVNYDGEILASDFQLSPRDHSSFSSSLSWGFYQLKRLVRQNLFVLNTIIFSTGFVYTMFAVTNALTIFNYAIFSLYLLQIVLIVLFHFTREKEWGEVLDISTGLPVAGAIVRLFDNERQLDVAITDRSGKYSFLLNPGTYYIRVSAPGYVFPTQDGPNIITNKGGEKLMKFSLQDTQRLTLKLYMQSYSQTAHSPNTQVILSPF